MTTPFSSAPALLSKATEICHLPSYRLPEFPISLPPSDRWLRVDMTRTPAKNIFNQYLPTRSVGEPLSGP